MQPMLRRRHKKSRTGCVECKRRHVKCDETRPVCSNCSTIGRTCVYCLDITPASFSQTEGVTPIASSPSSSKSPSPVATDAWLSPREHLTDIPTDHLTEAHDVGVNMVHMELFAHFSLEPHVPELDSDLRDYTTKLVISAGLSTPYLMHVILALSARHLAFLHPEKRPFYQLQAVELQTDAINLFNTTQPTVSASTCIPMLCFSTLLSRHLLTDILAPRDGDFAAFLDSYLHYAQVRSGARAMTHDTWDMMLTTRLRPLMEWGMGVAGTPGRGGETRRVCELVAGADLAPVEREACLKALGMLQVGLDDSAGEGGGLKCARVIFNWAVFVPSEFIELLRRRQPEAIVILGYYAALLHRGRALWQVGSAGAYLLRCIGEFLTHEWAHWLALPRDMVASKAELQS